jgi:hypothetical protein
LYRPNPAQETLICNAIAATTALETDTNCLYQLTKSRRRTRM